MNLACRFAPALLRAHVRSFGSPAAVADAALAAQGGKPALRSVTQLKTGQLATIERIQPSHLEQLRSFKDAGPNRIGDAHATGETTDSAIRELIWKAAAPRHDALLARLVGVGKVVATAELDPDVDELEAQLDTTLMESRGLRPDDVAVIRILVGAGHHHIGIGLALMRQLMRAAEQGGYRAIAGQTNSPAVRQIVEKLGGEGRYDQVLIPVRR